MKQIVEQTLISAGGRHPTLDELILFTKREIQFQQRWYVEINKVSGVSAWMCEK